MKVLIVDDSPVESLFLTVFLEDIALADCVDNGLDAVNMVQKAISDGKPYDLVCLDIVMQGMDGHLTLKMIRELEEQQGIKPVKIFMITSCDSPDQMIEAIGDGGCDDYIVKPVISDSLYKLLVKHGLLEE